ncbi:aromatic amino acid transaminase [Pantoea rwandensis]|uniref:Aminotransferase class I/classII large domain-containing protein n=1 Tax=Pantoea rwandensis TaxID=1076550 RepID=A0A1X1D3C2_9GAMM|nr:aromatic amino acid transaminase [Pantoea rwandensis]ORM71169.1 hypothetical protein HA51_04635 [Pantoea rwandensis]
MFKSLPPAARDTLWDITERFAIDHRPGKLDLILGMYRDETGLTPVLEAVKQAERKLAENAAPKTYKTMAGNKAFCDGMAKILLGSGNPRLKELVATQSVGGAGALRMLAELVAAANPCATVWTSDPGYVNHRPLMASGGLRVDIYPWKANVQGLDLAALFSGLNNTVPGDVLLIQGCCHNPAGIDPSFSQWEEIADFCLNKQLIPIIDMAYHGLGEGMDTDAAGLRLMVQKLETVLIAATCSKNMGLYCERVGVAYVVTAETHSLPLIRKTFEQSARRTYSMPPEHGAAIAAELFSSPTEWLAELDVMRQRIQSVRTTLAQALLEVGLNGFAGIHQHSGMFSLLPLSQQQMEQLRTEYAIYGTDEGRINIAGLTEQSARYVAKAILAVTQRSEVPGTTQDN